MPCTDYVAAVRDYANHFSTAAKASFSTSSPGDATAYRLREGIERFFITDINNPAGSAMEQSGIFVSFDDFRSTDANVMNHLPGGGNVLYLDGHAEFIRYPSAIHFTPI